MKRTGPTNQNLQMLIGELKEKSLAEGVRIWKRIAKDLERPTRQRRAVNVYNIDKYGKEGETVIVPGKVLGVGFLTKKLNVVAFTFSKQAEERINQRGKAMTIKELLKINPKGKGVRIIA